MDIKYIPEDKDFKNPPKLTWLSASDSHLVQVDMVEFGDLLTVPKVEPDHKFEDIINWNSKKTGQFLVESQIQSLVKGDIL